MSVLYVRNTEGYVTKSYKKATSLALKDVAFCGKCIIINENGSEPSGSKVTFLSLYSSRYGTSILHGYCPMVVLREQLCLR